GDAHLLLGAAFHQVDERVTGDLRGEAGAAGALDAALPVQQDLRGQRDRLGEGPLDVDEPALALPVGQRLVLQRAFTALVADRAVQRVVDEQELHDTALSFLRHRRGQLGLDHHAVRDGDGAGGLRFGHAAPVAHVGDLHQALAAGTDRVEQRVVAEPRDLDAEQFGRPDQQGALGNLDFETVDGNGDEVLWRHCGGSARGGVGRDCHQASSSTDSFAQRVVRWYGNSSHAGVWVPAMNSSRKYLIAEVTELVAPSPSAQKERPSRL